MDYEVEPPEKCEEIKITEYKGNPTLNLLVAVSSKTGKPYYFAFGYNKAKIILKYITEIRQFVEKNPPSKRMKRKPPTDELPPF